MLKPQGRAAHSPPWKWDGCPCPCWSGPVLACAHGRGRTLPVWRPAGSICIRAYKPLCHGTQLCRCPVAPSYPTLRNPMNCSTPGFPVHHQLPELTQTLMSIESVMPSNRLILCRPLLLLPSIFPSIRVFPVISWQSIGVSTSASVLPMNIQD